MTLVPWRSWLPVGPLYEHPDKADAAREEWIGRLRGSCEQSIRQRYQSPIYFMAMRAAGSLTARCEDLGRERAHCDHQLLFIHSDLRELSEEHITNALTELSRVVRRTERLPPVPPLPRIARAGIDAVGVCGIVDTAVGRGDRDIEPVVVTWNVPAVPTANVALVVLVMAGA